MSEYNVVLQSVIADATGFSGLVELCDKYPTRGRGH